MLISYDVKRKKTKKIKKNTIAHIEKRIEININIYIYIYTYKINIDSILFFRKFRNEMKKKIKKL